MTKRVALVAGASGLAGTRLAETLTQSGEWHVIGCSRQIPTSRLAGVHYVAVDLIDPSSCQQAARNLRGVTHFFYAARHTFVTGQHEDTDANTAMFRNMLDALEAADHPLQHVHLVHGTKYYGVQLGRHPTPSREDDPRRPQANFYYEQQDIVRARTGSRSWSWSASRPHCICDSSLATPRSLPLVIATYATISKHLGQPLCFPGTPGNYRAISQCTDAQLLARSIIWMATEPHCANQPFNVANGDFFRWENLWPEFARYFGMNLGPIRTISLAELMPNKAPIWHDIVAKHGLVALPYERMALWSYGDMIFAPDWDMMSSTTKLRHYGFHEVVDTSQMFFAQFDSFRRNNIIPSA